MGRREKSTQWTFGTNGNVENVWVKLETHFIGKKGFAVADCTQSRFFGVVDIQACVCFQGFLNSGGPVLSPSPKV